MATAIQLDSGFVVDTHVSSNFCHGCQTVGKKKEKGEEFNKWKEKHSAVCEKLQWFSQCNGGGVCGGHFQKVRGEERFDIMECFQMAIQMAIQMALASFSSRRPNLG